MKMAISRGGARARLNDTTHRSVRGRLGLDSSVPGGGRSSIGFNGRSHHRDCDCDRDRGRDRREHHRRRRYRDHRRAPYYH